MLFLSITQSSNKEANNLFFNYFNNHISEKWFQALRHDDENGSSQRSWNRCSHHVQRWRQILPRKMGRKIKICLEKNMSITISLTLIFITYINYVNWLKTICTQLILTMVRLVIAVKHYLYYLHATMQAKKKT